MKVNLKEVFNIPNVLCYIRILLIPFFCFYLITANAENSDRYVIAAVLIVLSGLTDLFDGLIARKCNMITELGKAIDPIADKLTQFSIAVCLTIKIPYMIYLVLIVFVKEIAMGILCLVLLRQKKKIDGAKWFGKVATAVYYASMFSIILVFITDANPVWNVFFIAIASAFMIFAFIMYMPVFYRLYKE